MNEMLKRELNKTYLVLNSEKNQYEESYELQMIVRNAPETILPLHVMRVDGELQLFYDVSARQTLLSCAEREKLSKDTICHLFETIDRMFKEIKDYLLDAQSIVLDLAHIYTKEGKFYFCYCPWVKKDTLHAFRMMLEEILGNLDYHDTKGVELAYHLYQSACQGSIQISEILNEHCEEAKKEIKTVTIMEEESLSDRAENSEVFMGEKAKPRKEKTQEHKKQETTLRKGLLYRVLSFFLKKQEPEEETDHPYVYPDEIPVPSFCKEDTAEYAETSSESYDGNTILLDHIPVRGWILQPLVSGYETFEMKEESFIIGKKRGVVDGYIDRETVSRIHSRLSVRQGRLFIADANSTNGTFVNGEVIEPGQEAEIFPGDRIMFADVGYECYNSL